MLCTPVTPFPSIGNAAYRQRAGTGPSHGHRQHAQKIWFNDRVCGSGDMLTGRQTHRQTHRQMCSSEYFAAALVGKVMKKLKTKKPRCSKKKWSSRKFRGVSPIYIYMMTADYRFVEGLLAVSDINFIILCKLISSCNYYDYSII